MEREVLEAEGLLGRILLMWNSRSYVAIEVVRGRHSISVAFVDSDVKIFWLLESTVPRELEEGGCFRRS